MAPAKGGDSRDRLGLQGKETAEASAEGTCTPCAREPLARLDVGARCSGLGAVSQLWDRLDPRRGRRCVLSAAVHGREPDACFDWAMGTQSPDAGVALVSLGDVSEDLWAVCNFCLNVNLTKAF